MKSILKGAALLSAAALIASCDSSSGGGSNNVVAPPAPQISATGSGTKGIMIGSAVVITDASGAEIARTTTNPDGTYDAALENSTQGGSINGPLTVTISGGQILCDFDIEGTTNDCPTGQVAPNDFVAFGEAYDAPANFTLRTAIPTPATGTTSHANILTEIAVRLAIAGAGTSAPTAAQIQTALDAVTGLFEALTGIEITDVSQLQAANLGNLNGNESAAVLALAGISAGIYGEGDADLAAVITSLIANVTLNANGQITGTGANLGGLNRVFARGLAVAADRSGNDVVLQAAATADALATALIALGNATAIISSGDADATATATKTLVANIAQAVSDITSTTGAQGFGDDGTVGATEAFVAELDAVAAASSRNATIAFNKLSTAITAAADAAVAGGDAVACDLDGVTCSVTKAADGSVSLTADTTATSVWPLPTVDGETSTDATDRVELAVTGGSATSTGSTNDFSFTGVTMTTYASGAVTQTFTGSVSNDFTAAVAADSTAGTAATEATDDFDFSGTITTAASGTGSSFAVVIDVNDEPRDVTANSTRGTYSATLTFTEADGSTLVLGLSGTIGAALQTYTVTGSGTPVVGTVTRSTSSTGVVTDINTLTDGGGATLTLTVTGGTVVNTDGVIGTFTEGTTTTATLGADGVVTFTDGSILVLPTIIFVPDNDSGSNQV